MAVKKNPNFFIGLSLSAQVSTESGLAILNDKLEIIRLDKLFSMDDIRHFFNNFSSLKNSVLCVSLPYDNSMLEGHWRLYSKPYTFFNDNKMVNRNEWLKRYSSRSNEFWNEIKDLPCAFYRYDISLTRMAFGLKSPFLNRSPLDCQFLQNALKSEFGLSELPTNMLSVAFLEGIMGALLAHRIAFGVCDKDYKKISRQFDFDVMLPILNTK